MQAVHIAASVSLFQDYPIHLISTICEWIAAFSLVLFFLTYVNDFKVSMRSSNASLFFYLSLEEALISLPFYFLQLFTLRVKTEYEE